jgi:hypothetical protein
MALVRRHLRLVATAWILFQATSLSALVPRACCLAHEAAMANKVADCHEPAPPQDCAMGDSEEAPCAMHHMHGSTHEHAAPPAQKPAGDCAIRGICGGPLSAIFAIFSTQGVLPDRIESLPALAWTSASLTVTDQLIGLFAPPDAPPPRA